MWMCIPDMQTARMSASGICMLDYLYIFGGKGDKGQFIRQIERINLKSLNKFELIDV